MSSRSQQEAYALVTCALCPTEFFRKDRSGILIENHHQQPNGGSTSCCDICPACANQIRENDPYGQIKDLHEIREHVKRMQDYTEGLEEAFDELLDEFEQAEAAKEEAQSAKAELQRKLQEAEAAKEEAKKKLEKEELEKAELQTKLLAAKKSSLDESKEILQESDEKIENLEWKLKSFSQEVAQRDNCDRLSDEQSSTGVVSGAATQRQNCDRASTKASEASKPFTKESRYDNERNMAMQAHKNLEDIRGFIPGVLTENYGRTNLEEDSNVMIEEAECATSVDASIEMLHKVAHLPHKFLDLYLSSYKWTVVHKKVVGFSRRAFTKDVVSAANNDAMLQRAEESGNIQSTKFHLSQHANMILSLRGLDKSRKLRQVWHDWLYVARKDYSKKDPISYGLFSCRRFQKGETIGPYAGNIVWENTFTKERWESRQARLLELDKLFLNATAFEMKGFVQTTEEETSIRIVSPLVTAERKVEDRLFMGFEFMARDNKKFNVEITSNGLVKALKILRKGDELVAPRWLED